MTYREIIDAQRKRLPKSRNWWSMYFYHFTDIRNALNIIEKGWIYARHKASEEDLMVSDNASPAVMSVSSSEIKEYARLYFRPKTPTQYHNEGYKPETVRKADINANCPVPIFFFLDAEKVLLMDGVEFSETTCAGTNDLNLLSGTESFANLPFDKIYHEGAFLPESRDDIIRHRQAEVVRRDGICIKDCLKGIVCRTPAEKQTLLYLLKTQYPDKYTAYKGIIRCDPSLDMFYNNGIFIRSLEYNGRLSIKLNDPEKRRKYSQNNAKVQCEVSVYFLSSDGNITGRSVANIVLDYLSETEIIIDLQNTISDFAIVEVSFDGNPMYKNIINLSIDSIM